MKKLALTLTLLAGSAMILGTHAFAGNCVTNWYNLSKTDQFECLDVGCEDIMEAAQGFLKISMVGEQRFPNFPAQKEYIETQVIDNLENRMASFVRLAQSWGYDQDPNFKKDYELMLKVLGEMGETYQYCSTNDCFGKSFDFTSSLQFSLKCTNPPNGSTPIITREAPTTSTDKKSGLPTGLTRVDKTDDDDDQGEVTSNNPILIGKNPLPEPIAPTGGVEMICDNNVDLTVPPRGCSVGSQRGNSLGVSISSTSARKICYGTLSEQQQRFCLNKEKKLCRHINSFNAFTEKLRKRLLKKPTKSRIAALKKFRAKLEEKSDKFEDILDAYHFNADAAYQYQLDRMKRTAYPYYDASVNNFEQCTDHIPQKGDHASKQQVFNEISGPNWDLGEDPSTGIVNKTTAAMEFLELNQDQLTPQTLTIIEDDFGESIPDTQTTDLSTPMTTINNPDQGFLIPECPPPGTSCPVITIGVHGTCKILTNTSGNVYFVPTATQSEWLNFIDAVDAGSLNGLSAQDCTPTCSVNSQCFSTGPNAGMRCDVDCDGIVSNCRSDVSCQIPASCPSGNPIAFTAINTCASGGLVPGSATIDHPPVGAPSTDPQPIKRYDWNCVGIPTSLVANCSTLVKYGRCGSPSLQEVIANNSAHACSIGDFNTSSGFQKVVSGSSSTYRWTCDPINAAGNAAASCSISACGDGSFDAGEQCDDGANNGTSGSNCTTSCTCASGLVPDGSGGCTTCGNNQKDSGEQCDFSLGSSNPDGVGCTQSCMCDTANGFVFNGTVCAKCGDGIINAGEQCDDGNQIDTDGCNNQCQCGAPYVFDGAKCTTCGNGVKDGGERCDYSAGHNVQGVNTDDHCTLHCQPRGNGLLDPKFVCGDYSQTNYERCMGGSTDVVDSCSEVCQPMRGNSCGDGKTDGGSERCDGGTVVQDLTTGKWKLHFTTPNPPGSSIVGCESYMGNIEVTDPIRRPNPVNVCPTSSQRCDSQCQIVAVCGDGHTQQGEQCDPVLCPKDANGTRMSPCNASTPGATVNLTCNLDCTVKNTSPACGNGQVDASANEACDESAPRSQWRWGPSSGQMGNYNECYSCTKGTQCGNRVVEVGEKCDGVGPDSCWVNEADPNQGRMDCAAKNGGLGQSCDSACLSYTNAYCGDGIIDSAGGEQCDDGNRIDFDGCSSGCMKETYLTLGGQGGARWSTLYPCRDYTSSWTCNNSQSGNRCHLYHGSTATCNGTTCASYSGIGCSGCPNGTVEQGFGMTLQDGTQARERFCVLPNTDGDNDDFWTVIQEHEDRTRYTGIDPIYRTDVYFMKEGLNGRVLCERIGGEGTKAFSWEIREQPNGCQ